MKFIITYCMVSLAIISLVAQIAFAEVYKYTDLEGNTHFVDSLAKVPEQYKDTIKSAESFPKIGKVPGGSFPTPNSNKQLQKNSAKKIEIFVTSWCPYCRKLEAYLSAKNVSFKRYDIEKDSEGRKIYNQIGGRGIPVSKIGDTVVQGFEAGEIDAALSQAGLNKK